MEKRSCSLARGPPAQETPPDPPASRVAGTPGTSLSPGGFPLPVSQHASSPFAFPVPAAGFKSLPGTEMASQGQSCFLIGF